jgi:hypothetical protein
MSQPRAQAHTVYGDDVASCHCQEGLQEVVFLTVRIDCKNVLERQSDIAMSWFRLV